MFITELQRVRASSVLLIFYPVYIAGGKTMNKTTITLKVDDYTIILHRGPEEPKEMEQKRMARYVKLAYAIWQ